MAISIDNGDSGSNATGGVTVNMAVSAGASAVTALTCQGSSVSITEMSIDSVEMDFVQEVVANSRTTRQYKEETPNTGALIPFTLGTGSSNMVHLHALTLFNVDTADMIGDNSTSFGSSNNPNDSLTLELDDTFVYEHFFFNSTATTVSSANDGQTLQSDLANSYSSFTYINNNLSSGSYSPDYTLSNSKNWNMATMEIRPSAAVGHCIRLAGQPSFLVSKINGGLA